MEIPRIITPTVSQCVAMSPRQHTYGEDVMMTPHTRPNRPVQFFNLSHFVIFLIPLWTTYSLSNIFSKCLLFCFQQIVKSQSYKVQRVLYNLFFFLVFEFKWLSRSYTCYVMRLFYTFFRVYILMNLYLCINI